MKSAIGSGLKVAFPPAMTSGSVSSRSAVSNGTPPRSSTEQRVGVERLVGERDRRSDRTPAGVFGFQADTAAGRRAQRRLHIRPGGKDALGQHVRLSVEDVVQNARPRLDMPRSYTSGKTSAARSGDRLPVLDDLVELAAGVASGLLDARQQAGEGGSRYSDPQIACDRQPNSEPYGDVIIPGKAPRAAGPGLALRRSARRQHVTLSRPTRPG